MRYTINLIENRKVYKTYEVATLTEALKQKKANNIYLVGVYTQIIDNETNKEVKTVNNYYGRTKVYRKAYIKMY